MGHDVRAQLALRLDPHLRQLVQDHLGEGLATVVVVVVHGKGGCEALDAHRDLLVAQRRLMIQGDKHARSEEHTSELQSLMRISYAVFCLTKKNILCNQNTTDHAHYKHNTTLR